MENKIQSATPVEQTPYIRQRFLPRAVGKLLEYLLASYAGAYLAKFIFPAVNKWSDRLDALPDDANISNYSAADLVMWGESALYIALVSIAAYLLLTVVVSLFKPGQTFGKLLTRTTVYDSKTAKPASAGKILAREMIGLPLVWMLSMVSALLYINGIDIELAQMIIMSAEITIPLLIIFYPLISGRKTGHRMGRSYYDRALGLETIIDPVAINKALANKK